MAVHWDDGLEAEARSARRGREEAIKQLQHAKRSIKYFWASVVLVSAATMWNLAGLAFGDGGLFSFVIFVVGVVFLAWLTRLHHQLCLGVWSAEGLLSERQRHWDDVCRRLGRGEQ